MGQHSHYVGLTWSFISIRSGRKLRRDWGCWVLSWTGVASPSGAVSYSTGSLSVPGWTMRAGGHVRNLRVFQSKCLRIASGAPWYISNRETYEDLGVTFFANHIRAVTINFDSELAGVGTPYYGDLVDTCADRRLTRVTESQAMVDCCQQTRRRSAKNGCQVDKTNRAKPVPSRHFSATLTEVFLRVFLSCKANAREWCKDGARPAFLLRHNGLIKVPAGSCVSSACDCYTLGSNPKKPPYAPQNMMMMMIIIIIIKAFVLQP
jgi:hypothetical protein